MAKALKTPTIRRLGRKPPDPNKQRSLLRMARYLIPGQVPDPPPSTNWRAKTKPPWGMFLNDQYGCCTCTSLAHGMQVWTANQGNEVTVSDQDVLTMYNLVNGGRDEGAQMIDVLNVYRRKGFAGRRLGGYVAVTPQDIREVKEAIYLTGGLYMGVDLPISAQDQLLWDYPDARIKRRDKWLWEPGGWGGHAIFGVDYDSKGVYAPTWGNEVLITWDWLAEYLMEAYALIAPEWVNNRKKAPNGLAVKELLRDVQIATGEKVA